jgi:hypothetical protein
VAEAFSGESGAGSLVVYTVPRAYDLRLDVLTFAVTTDTTAGIHHAKVVFTDKALNAVTARLRDLNEGGPSMTLRYTYGVGLSASACVAADGWEMTDALPVTVLAPQTNISISVVNDAGTVIAGDAISGVVLYGDLATVAASDDGPPVLLASGFLPGSAEA